MIYDVANPITIVMADDHEVVRAGLRRLLSVDKELKIVDEASNGRDALELVKYHKPDIALLDIMMPVMNGIECVRQIKRSGLDTFTVMLTAFEDSSHLEQALSAGADGYLAKDVGSKELINSLKKVIFGERVFSKSIILLLQNKFSVETDTTNESIVITKREQEILNLVAIGKKSIEIADALSISVRTVESHRYNIMQKLGIKNTAGLIRYAVMNNPEAKNTEKD